MHARGRGEGSFDFVSFCNNLDCRWRAVCLRKSSRVTGIFVGFKEAGVFGDPKGAVRFDFLFDVSPESRELLIIKTLGRFDVGY